MSKHNDTSYEVGYGKPPEKTKFKPGQSGNKKGRPKAKMLSIHESAYVAVATTPVTIKIDGKKTTVTTEYAVWLKLRQDALNGDPKALKMWVQAWSVMVKHGVIKPSNPEDKLASDKPWSWDAKIAAAVEEAVAYVEGGSPKKQTPPEPEPVSAPNPQDNSNGGAAVAPPSEDPAANEDYPSAKPDNSSS